MAAKVITEHSGKELLYKHFEPLVGKVKQFVVYTPRIVRLCDKSEIDEEAKKILARNYENSDYLEKSQFVLKPDQRVKRRYKHGLVMKGTLKELNLKLKDLNGKPREIDNVTGILNSFILEPYIEHEQEEELYLAIVSKRDCDEIIFRRAGGVDVGDVDMDSRRLRVPVGTDNLMIPTVEEIVGLLGDIKEDAAIKLGWFIDELYCVYKKLHFTYLEINPLVISAGTVYILDLAAKLDQTAAYVCEEYWNTRSNEPIDFPAPFGQTMSQEEKFIAQLDEKTGASLKLTILNRKGRIWTMIAGGGASVVFTDAVCEYGFAHELANYGEYSGDPTVHQTTKYAETIFSVMTEGDPHPVGKILLIGGSIANFTNVGQTFQGIIRALEMYATKLQEHQVQIYVRRGGPNYKEGLRKMKEAGERLGLHIEIYGPEVPLTAIVGLALGKTERIESAPTPLHANFLMPNNLKLEFDINNRDTHLNTDSTMSDRDSVMDDASQSGRAGVVQSISSDGSTTSVRLSRLLFDRTTQAVIWGQQPKVIQGMLDFDYVCRRSIRSVAASTYPFAGDCTNKFYFGQSEVFVPNYRSMVEAFKEHPEADVLICFASHRSTYEVVLSALHEIPQLRLIVMIAEGIPERFTRHLISLAASKQIMIIGPATVGAIKPGCFKVGNTGGMMDNILASKLYRPGSVAYISRSGGLSNELNNIISLNSDGVYEGIAIGGDRYPGSTFSDHLARFLSDRSVRIIVILGENGGCGECDVVELLRKSNVKKTVIGWCIGTCSSVIGSEVQFGHAGSGAASQRETASHKNQELERAGVLVPKSFDGLGELIARAYKKELFGGRIKPMEEVIPPPVPLDYAWARELGIIRKPTSFITTICDERGEEPLYSGVPITQIIEKELGIGGVLSLLWFRKELPSYGNKFLELCLLLTADHGPAVSGAHNTIVCTRAGSGLVSALSSGLLTIGDRFGGALDGAAKQFSEALDRGLTPAQFVEEMRKKGQLIMGIGHRVKSIHNPDIRVELLKEFAKEQFKQKTPLLAYALEVEQITTAKKPNLILNVDGAIGVILVDLLRHSNAFSEKEAQEMIDIGAFNSIFVLGRSIGLIGHYLDQRRLKQGLYRHPWDDISYVMPERDDFAIDL